nr:MAG TPA: hypothetical protein [Caudoviricetes sp.]
MSVGLITASLLTLTTVSTEVFVIVIFLAPVIEKAAILNIVPFRNIKL